VRVKFVENAIVGTTQINGENQNCRKIKNNKNKTKLRPHNTTARLKIANPVFQLKSEARNNEKHEIRSTKQYQNSNAQIFKTYCFGDLNFGHLDLFRISIFEFRI